MRRTRTSRRFPSAATRWSPPPSPASVLFKDLRIGMCLPALTRLLSGLATVRTGVRRRLLQPRGLAAHVQGDELRRAPPPRPQRALVSPPRTAHRLFVSSLVGLGQRWRPRTMCVFFKRVLAEMAMPATGRRRRRSRTRTPRRRRRCSRRWDRTAWSGRGFRSGTRAASRRA